MENTVEVELPLEELPQEMLEAPVVTELHVVKDTPVDWTKIKEETIQKMRAGDSVGQFPIHQVAGVYVKGVQYYDFSNVGFINNTVMARLIYLLKSLLRQGIEIRFVNVGEGLKSKIRAMGLENIFNCT